MGLSPTDRQLRDFLSPKFIPSTSLNCLKLLKKPLKLINKKKNGNTLWADAIAKEMRDVRGTFKILPDGQPAPVGYQRIPCHMIFDIKM